jgi:phosphohistidine phosphatase
MKRVILVRHAKAVPYGYDDDFSRDLKNPRGLNDAQKVSLEMRNYSIIPDLIISSPARRALKTARIFAENLGYQPAKILTEDDLYEGISTHEFVERLNNLDDKINVVYVFGHNPTLYYIIKGLAPAFNNEMPTCSAVGIDFKVKTWKDITDGTGVFSFQETPQMIK